MVRRLALMVVADIQPVQNMTVLAHVGDAKKADWALHWITEGFKSLEAVLALSAGTYAFGDAPTMADFCIVPQVYNARRYNVKMDAFPIISRITANFERLDFAIASHPDAQPDAVKQ